MGRKQPIMISRQQTHASYNHRTKWTETIHHHLNYLSGSQDITHPIKRNGQKHLGPITISRQDTHSWMSDRMDKKQKQLLFTIRQQQTHPTETAGQNGWEVSITSPNYRREWTKTPLHDQTAIYTHPTETAGQNGWDVSITSPQKQLTYTPHKYTVAVQNII